MFEFTTYTEYSQSCSLATNFKAKKLHCMCTLVCVGDVYVCAYSKEGLRT